ncbi:glycosyltransferase [Butyrivibrio sp. XPD2002]|uniref:glycosyltransferase n=1 Tax=Butyrivibrio sp. XPD2002 TaxID=1280665 RepID=UPI00040BA7AB|nr:glycosyltransferase [Butyrivibrio sp. XPD2002]
MVVNKDVVVVIPSLNPDEKLIYYVDTLIKLNFKRIIVIDDGSAPSFQHIFDALDERVMLVRHERNLGKGAALKTGFKQIEKYLRDAKYIITADSDGQHTSSDLEKVVLKMRGGADNALYLGTRNFHLPDIPFKSRAGNRITSAIFFVLYGRYLPDTQTGLRGFSKRLLPFMIETQGERYEYEMNVLIRCAQKRIPFVGVPIDTIYENNNKGSHFNPVTDSFRIYRILIGNFLLFARNSLMCMFLDQGLFFFLDIILFTNGDTKAAGYIFASTAIARVISGIVNYSLNQKYVFDSNRNKGSFFRYTLLCGGIMLASAFGTWGLSTLGMHSNVAKAFVDLLLYFASYKFQQIWVFEDN